MKDFCKKNYHWIIMIIFYILLVMLHHYTLIYGDDYLYSTAAKHGPKGFYEFHVHHYLKSNGRALIHIFVTLALTKPGMVIWKILNPLIFLIIFYNIAKTFTDRKEDFQLVILVLCIIWLSFGSKYTSNSIFTITPVFNYIYPFLIMFPLLKNLIKTYSGKMMYSLPVMGFISGATMEQTGIMIIGYTILLSILMWIEQKKLPTKMAVITLIMEIIGYATVMFAPGNILRMGKASRPFSENFVAIWTMLINQKTFLIFNIVLIFAVCYWLIILKEDNVIVKIMNKGIAVCLVVGMLINVALIYELFQYNFESTGIINIIWKMFDLLYIASLIYMPVYIAIKRKEYGYLMHMIIGMGSIFILLFASISEWRPLTPALVVFSIFIALTIVDLMRNYKSFGKYVICVMCIAAIAVFDKSFQGYYENYRVKGNNDEIIKIYKHSRHYEKELILHKCADPDAAGYAINITNKEYIYPLPANHTLLDQYSLKFKQYYGIPKEVGIKIQ